MAMVKCPKCGIEISDSLGECFSCGYILESLSVNSTQAKSNISIPSKIKPTINTHIRPNSPIKPSAPPRKQIYKRNNADITSFLRSKAVPLIICGVVVILFASLYGIQQYNRMRLAFSSPISSSSYNVSNNDFSDNAAAIKETDTINETDVENDIIDSEASNTWVTQQNAETSFELADDVEEALSQSESKSETIRPSENEIIPIDKTMLHENARDYEGKWVKIAGMINSISYFDEYDALNLTGKSELRAVRCYLASDQDTSSVKESEYVTVVGKVQGKILGQLLLEECYIDGHGEESKNLEMALLEKADQDDKATAIQLTAIQAYQEYTTNQVACKNKYEGKYVAISGTIDDIGTNIFGQEYVTFDVGDEWAVETVQCFFKNEMMDYVSTLNKGQKITLYGIADIGSLSFKVGDCHP